MRKRVLFIAATLLFAASTMIAQTKVYAVYCPGSGYDINPSILYFLTSDTKPDKSYDNHTITAVWEEEEITNTGGTAPVWNATIKSLPLKVVFEESFKDVTPVSCYKWFDGCTKLSAIEGLTNLNTSQVTDMRYMFKGCSNLESLDISGFNTGIVTDMGYAFDGCGKLMKIDMRRFTGTMVKFLATGDFAQRGMMFIVPATTTEEEKSNDIFTENYIVVPETSTSFARSFTSGNMSTVYFPFAIATADASGTFYKYDSHDGENVVFKEVTDEMTTANTPYLFKPSATGRIAFNGQACTELPADTDENDEAGLYGVYSPKTFNSDEAGLGIYYGWAEGKF